SCRPRCLCSSGKMRCGLVGWTPAWSWKRGCSRRRWAPTAKREAGSVGGAATDRARLATHSVDQVGLAARRRRRAVDVDGVRPLRWSLPDHAQEPDIRRGMGTVCNGRQLSVVRRLAHFGQAAGPGWLAGVHWHQLAAGPHGRRYRGGLVRGVADGLATGLCAGAGLEAVGAVYGGDPVRVTVAGVRAAYRVPSLFCVESRLRCIRGPCVLDAPAGGLVLDRGRLRDPCARARRKAL